MEIKFLHRSFSLKQLKNIKTPVAESFPAQLFKIGAQELTNRMH